MSNLAVVFGGFGIVVIVVLLFVIGPALFIWAVNTLFGLNIAFTFWNWLAAAILIGLVNGGSSSSSSS